jgi:tetratricopeptide (TPR) repeat protein
VVRYLDGRREYGVCFALNLKDVGFHLDLCDSEGTPLGKTNYAAFRDLKAVFLVKSFDGKYDRSVRYKDFTAEGGEMVARFKDGETIKGYCLHRYDPDEPRFHLIPADPTTNNISIVVEKSALQAVYSPEEYRRVQEEEQAAKGADSSGLSQEETTGDFYFETRNYAAAMEQYRIASEKFPHVRRLQKKILMAHYNIGVNFIKRHEYDKALVSMETVLKGDPHNERVRKKVAQLRHIIQKSANPGAASAEPGLQD